MPLCATTGGPSLDGLAANNRRAGTRAAQHTRQTAHVIGVACALPERKSSYSTSGVPGDTNRRATRRVRARAVNHSEERALFPCSS